MNLAFGFADFNTRVSQEDLQFSVLYTILDRGHIPVLQDGNIPFSQAFGVFRLDHISVTVGHCPTEDGEILTLTLEREDRNGTDKRHIQFAGDQAGRKFRRAGELGQGYVQAFFLEVTFFPGDESEQMSCGIQIAKSEVGFFNSGGFRTGRNSQ